MDQSVKDAIARWPDVPAVHGWLSLDERGRWRLHPQGDAASGGPGEPITNEQILAFMGRNYAVDPQGRWYFQNGPQRVYVRLDAAPYILRVAGSGAGLLTHTGQDAGEVTGWWLDDTGRLYAVTALGPGMIEDRDLGTLLARLHTDTGAPLLDALEGLDPDGMLQVCLPGQAACTPLRQAARADIPTRLAFNAMPTP
ncbi:Protein of uncharacterised function (DUF2946) [Bordetella ansorpii]|uniref:Protein of uncharacterized function (DUF2946) n=1 Tax=Bordetella ansorpii TaxID=288768 RepID=A0A157PDE4_9BORD|nr:DUF2946 family protein [Bordetella ansorpii]SAI31330.1 Protein of uncharacterised function (DUF2946) [Bordetella ansorpii]